MQYNGYLLTSALNLLMGTLFKASCGPSWLEMSIWASSLHRLCGGGVEGVWLSSSRCEIPKISVRTWSLSVHAKYFGSCGIDPVWLVVWQEALIYGGSWIGLGYPIWAVIMASFLPVSLFSLNVSAVMQFKERVDVCELIMSKLQLKPRVISSAGWCCSIFPGGMSETSSALSFFLVLDSALGKMPKIIPRGNEEIWRRLVWYEILSYL